MKHGEEEEVVGGGRVGWGEGKRRRREKGEENLHSQHG